eukprot:9933836-Ditylum_brightwellii.AAC.1
MDSLIHSRQSIAFSGVGTAHQNGIAKRIIKTICNTAQVPMIHAAVHKEEGVFLRNSDQWQWAMLPIYLTEFSKWNPPTVLLNY